VARLPAGPPHLHLRRHHDCVIEQSYQQMKEELGLDHFEGRSWRGWNHHVVLVLLAYAFLQDVRRRRPKKVTPA
jgi:SRSO17 transposase